MPIPAPQFTPPTQGPPSPAGPQGPVGPPAQDMAGGAPPGMMGGGEQVSKEAIRAELEKMPIEQLVEFLKQPPDSHLPTLMENIKQSPDLQGASDEESDQIAFLLATMTYEVMMAYVQEKTNMTLEEINPQFAEPEKNPLELQGEGQPPIPAPQMGGPPQPGGPPPQQGDPNAQF